MSLLESLASLRESKRFSFGEPPREFQYSNVSPDTEAMTALVTDSGRKTPARLAGSAILSMQSDERLVKLARSGHERAFDAIVDRYRKPLVRYCRRILPESRCEDAVQQAFLNAHTALTSSDEAVQLKPWLFAITRNAALNMLRQNGWNYEEIPLDFDGVRRPDQVFEQRIELQQTVAALNDLPQRQRDALVMREFEGRSYDEIALALGANDGAVRQLLNRARVTLRSAASALIPPPFVARAAASMPPSDGRRLAEIFGGLGAAGIAKAGATAVVAGTLVVGAVKAPLPVNDSHKVTREKATLAVEKPATARTAHSAAQPIANHPTAAGVTHPARTHAPAGRHQGSNHSGHGRSGSATEPREVEHEGRVEERHRSGSDDGRSGSDDSPTRQTTTETEDRSGSGRSGSDDNVTAALPSTDGSLSSGTSGSGTSGSETSGSGTSGSGESTSGSSDSINSGSGSTSSGSGSDDSTHIDD
jgi:RNA polymerase sigma factor (sigma-70 family)